MQKELNNLLDAIAIDYADYMKRMAYNHDGANLDTDRLLETIGNFHSGLEIAEGRNYYKIIRNDTQRSVWGFIVKNDGPKFRAGDILKAAGWKAPATNAARGNIIDGGYDIRWTGPLYL